MRSQDISRFPAKINGDVLYEGIAGAEKGVFYNGPLATSNLIDLMEAKFGIGKIPESKSLNLHIILSVTSDPECKLSTHPMPIIINNIRLRI